MTETSIRHPKDYSKGELVLGNLAILLWIGLGALSCALFYALASLLFFGVAAFLVFFELGKHGCVSCYYCKTCTIGMGKLPGLFFKKAGTANVNRRALRLFPLAYLLLAAVPVALTVLSLFQEVTVFKVVLLASILAFSIYCGAARWSMLSGIRQSRVPRKKRVAMVRPLA